MAGSGTAHLRPGDDMLLRVENLVVDFPAGGGRHVSAVANVSLDVAERETLGLVGESGCGKSTTARAVIQLPKPTGGKVTFAGHELTAPAVYAPMPGSDCSVVASAGSIAAASRPRSVT